MDNHSPCNEVSMENHQLPNKYHSKNNIQYKDIVYIYMQSPKRKSSTQYNSVPNISLHCYIHQCILLVLPYCFVTIKKNLMLF